MTSYVHLVGADTVQSAARTISHAADRMSSTALNIEATCERFTAALTNATDAMNRLAAALERSGGLPPNVEAGLDAALERDHGVRLSAPIETSGKVFCSVCGEECPSPQKCINEGCVKQGS